MIFPVAHTNPTELVSALLTRHVIAALILFNPRQALGTGLRICQDPISRFRFVTTLFIPARQVFAGRGAVGFFAAHQTK